MKPAGFQYQAPESIQEVLELIAGSDNYRLLAGGQSLVPMLNLRLLAPDILVDLNSVSELAGIQDEAKVLRIGTMTRQRTLEKSALVRRTCPLLAFALEHVGHQQTRNRGTFGGSLCHMDPGAELPVAAAALDATMMLASSRGTRTLKFSEFPAGLLEANIQPGEILTHVEVPKLDPGSGAAFEEFSRRPADFAIVSCACILTLDKHGAVTALSLALGGIAPIPLRLYDVEKAALGRRFDAALVAAARTAAASVPAEDAGEYSASYRSRLAGVLTQRALQRAYERSTNSNHG